MITEFFFKCIMLCRKHLVIFMPCKAQKINQCTDNHGELKAVENDLIKLKSSSYCTLNRTHLSLERFIIYKRAVKIVVQSLILVGLRRSLPSMTWSVHDIIGLLDRIVRFLFLFAVLLVIVIVADDVWFARLVLAFAVAMVCKGFTTSIRWNVNGLLE